MSKAALEILGLRIEESTINLLKLLSMFFKVAEYKINI